MSETQDLSFRVLDDPQVTDVLFGGSAGGAKTFLACLWAVIRCRNYPGIAIGLGRKTLQEIKKTTLITLISKVHPLLEVTKSEFKFNAQEGTITYINGSKIVLIDMAWQPSDPDYDRFGSLELTDVIIEEVGEVHKKAVDVLTTRKNRMMNKEYQIVGKTLMTCNPTLNFVKKEYYDVYEKLGGGRMQQWQKGEVYLPSGEKVPAMRVYVRSSVYDNPFIDLNYIEDLKTKDPQIRKRLLEGDWSYADDDDVLFKTSLLDRATTLDFPAHIEGEPFNRFLGVDVADKGKDNTVATLIDNGVIVVQKVLIVDKTANESGQIEKSISGLYADELIKFAQQNGFTPRTAKNIAIEGNGVGVGMRDRLRERGWFITVYEANSSARSTGYYNFMLDMDEGSVKILNDIDDGELKRQLIMHTYNMVDQKPVICKKEVIKQSLGHSPDEADSAMISNWIRRGGFSKDDPSQNQNRISF